MQEPTDPSQKLRGSLSTEEELLLQKWLRESPKNREIFEQFQLLNEKGLDFTAYSQLDAGEGWNKVVGKLDRMKEKRRIRSLVLFSLKYAALLIGVLAISVAIYRESLYKETLVPADYDVITLQLEDGSVEILDSNGKSVIKDRQGKAVGQHTGKSIQYLKGSETKAANGKASYNILSVPYGKQFRVALSDGTNIHLNAGSSLRYPTHFEHMETREVFLKGEAFFEVAKNEKVPFFVHVDDMKVKVVGTSFNISNYADDNAMSTVLVEGAVHLFGPDSIYSHSSGHKLVPGQMAVWQRKKGKVSVKNVDTQLYTAWIQGRMVFRNSSFKDIRIKLERQYNTPIENHYAFLDQQVFNATFDGETLAEVLDSFKEDTAFQYQWKNDKIIITPP
ncbi:MAG: FecR domain-containing protein [Sediminicola sp.]|tara:strand:+ start:35694 stop:36866 length:1173 start_codon:yes stop_codon:yes gene_type:complete